MPIRFKCPHCQKPLSVKDHLAGKRAPCPACKQVLRIPAPAAPTPAPADAPSQADVEALAATAFADEPAVKAAEQDEAKPIIFTCNWCDEEVQTPLENAGKQIPCPNPECRRIVKVPLPKQEKPKDWREIAKKQGPSAAAISQVEKLEGVMSSRDDKAKVSRGALVEAGVVKLPPKPSIGARGWIRRGLWGTVVAAGVVGVILAGSRLKFEKELEVPPDLPKVAEIQGMKLASPVPLAELHCYHGLLYARGLKPAKGLREFQNSRGNFPQDVGAKTSTIDRDLFLGELAVAQVEIGGSEDEVIAKDKLPWQDVYKELGQTLVLIKAPEARAWAVRDVATRLLQKELQQKETEKQKLTPLAIGLAAQLAGTTAPVNGRQLLDSQRLAIAVARDLKKLLDELPKAPDLTKDIDATARVGYAEGYVRKEKVTEALELCQAKGYPHDQLEACVGAAAVLLATGKTKEEAHKAARPFLEEGLKAADAALAAAAQRKAAYPSPWHLLHLLRMTARVGMLPEEELSKKLLPGLPAAYHPRAQLELFMARCENAKEPLLPPSAEDLKKDEATMALALMWAGRQNGWFHQRDDLLQYIAEGEWSRFRPLALLGLAIGQNEPRR